MDWLTAVSLGACGGAIVQALAFFSRLQAWQEARLKARAPKRRSRVPLLTSYIDPLADILVLITRVGLGALAGGLLHAQVSGAYAAVAIGAAAPALLRQVGGGRNLPGSDIPEGTRKPLVTSKALTDLEPQLAEDG